MMGLLGAIVAAVGLFVAAWNPTIAIPIWGAGLAMMWWDADETYRYARREERRWEAQRRADDAMYTDDEWLV